MMTNKKTKQTVAFVVAGILLASFMGSMGILPTTQTTTIQQASAFGHGGERGLYFWQTAHCSTETSCLELRADTTAAERGTTSNLIFHYGPIRDTADENDGQQPTQLHIDHMLYTVNTANDFKLAQVGMQGISLAHLEQLADVVETNFPGGWLGYNLESGLSPAAEVSDPVGSFQEAEDIAEAHGLRLLAVPANSLLNSNPQAANIAATADMVVVNVAGLQDSDCTEARDEVIDNVDRIRSVHSNKAIVFQISLSRDGATQAMMQTCLDETLNAANPGASGWAIWWDNAAIDNNTWRNSNLYAETNFPSA